MMVSEGSARKTYLRAVSYGAANDWCQLIQIQIQIQIQIHGAVLGRSRPSTSIYRLCSSCPEIQYNVGFFMIDSRKTVDLYTSGPCG